MKISIEVPYRDIDAMGHLNNAVYFSYFELGRQKYWERVLGGLRRVLDIGFVMASAAIDYRRPVYMGDLLELEIRCPRTGRSSFDFSYALRRGGELVAEGRSTQVLWDWDRNLRREFDDGLRERIRLVETEVAT